MVRTNEPSVDLLDWGLSLGLGVWHSSLVISREQQLSLSCPRGSALLLLVDTITAGVVCTWSKELCADWTRPVAETTWLVADLVVAFPCRVDQGEGDLADLIVLTLGFLLYSGVAVFLTLVHGDFFAACLSWSPRCTELNSLVSIVTSSSLFHAHIWHSLFIFNNSLELWLRGVWCVW